MFVISFSTFGTLSSNIVKYDKADLKSLASEMCSSCYRKKPTSHEPYSSCGGQHQVKCDFQKSQPLVK